MRANHSACKSTLSFVPEFTVLWRVIGLYLFSRHFSFPDGASAVMVWNQKKERLDTHTVIHTAVVFFGYPKVLRIQRQHCGCLCISQLEGKTCHSVCASRKCDWYSYDISNILFKILKRIQFSTGWVSIHYCAMLPLFNQSVLLYRIQFFVSKITLVKFSYWNENIFPISGSTFKPLNPVKRLEKSRKRSRRTTIMGIPNQVQKELGMFLASSLHNQQT